MELWLCFGKTLGWEVCLLNQFPRVFNLEVQISVKLKFEHELFLYSDRSFWSFWSMEDFSVTIAMSYIDEKLLSVLSSSMRWIRIVSKKINIFAWHLALDRHPTRVLDSRGVDVPSILCPLCDLELESGSH